MLEIGFSPTFPFITNVTVGVSPISNNALLLPGVKGRRTGTAEKAVKSFDLMMSDQMDIQIEKVVKTSWPGPVTVRTDDRDELKVVDRIEEVLVTNQNAIS